MLHQRDLRWSSARSIFDPLAEYRFDLHHEAVSAGELAALDRLPDQAPLAFGDGSAEELAVAQSPLFLIRAQCQIARIKIEPFAVYFGTKSANIVSGSAITLSVGIFGSVEELRRVMEDTLRKLVDTVLDDQDFRKAVEQ